MKDQNQTAGNNATQISAGRDVYYYAERIPAGKGEGTAPETGISSEVVVFELDAQFVLTESDFEELVKRAVVAAEMGFYVQAEVRLQEIDESQYQNVDPLAVARHRRSRIDWTTRASKKLSLLFSEAVRTAWSTYFNSVEDFVNVARTLLTPSYPETSGTKLDVWRTMSPQLSAPVFLSEAEVDDLLIHLEFSHMKSLAMGAYWRAADELPRTLIQMKVIPSILEIFVRHIDMTEPISHETFALPSWHIGEG